MNGYNELIISLQPPYRCTTHTVVHTPSPFTCHSQHPLGSLYFLSIKARRTMPSPTVSNSQRLDRKWPYLPYAANSDCLLSFSFHDQCRPFLRPRSFWMGTNNGRPAFISLRLSAFQPAFLLSLPKTLACSEEDCRETHRENASLQSVIYTCSYPPIQSAYSTPLDLL